MPHTKEFDKLYAALGAEYFRKPVPKKFQDRYGKRYDQKDIKSMSYAVAKSKHIPIDRRSK